MKQSVYHCNENLNDSGKVPSKFRVSVIAKISKILSTLFKRRFPFISIHRNGIVFIFFFFFDKKYREFCAVYVYGEFSPHNETRNQKIPRNTADVVITPCGG